VSQEERSIFWEVTVSVMCPIPNGFRDTAISLYSSKTVDKKEILRTVSNTVIYCSSNKAGTVYLVQYISENSTVNINALCNSCEDMACCSSECILTFPYVGYNIHNISETARNKIHIKFLLRMVDTMTSQNIDLSSWDTCIE
jgi:hypothetical protein